MELEDFEDLINFAISAKKRLFLNEFGENASNSPNINSKTVLPLTKQNFRSPIP